MKGAAAPRHNRSPQNVTGTIDGLITHINIIYYVQYTYVGGYTVFNFLIYCWPDVNFARKAFNAVRAACV